VDETLPRPLEHPDDCDWDMTGEVLLQDHDILDLFDVELDGIGTRTVSKTERWGWVTTASQAWFRAFLNMNPRDGRRTFRS
jgi:hypothetical protein